MSKATEWSKSNVGMSYDGARAVAGIGWLRPDSELVLTVAPIKDGYSGCYFTPDEALALARWITDVFGEGGGD